MASDKVTIRFEGRALTCRSGTSVAVALWEQGIRHLSHSPKYGRPRGLTCARGHCTACLMRVDGVPNVRVCETPVREGMTIERQDRGAFYAVPMQAVLAAGDRFFPVGFYYKWFTRPPFVSRTFLRTIRPLTGIGRLPAASAGPPPPATTGERPVRDLGHRATVVIGAGGAGLRAAVRAAGPVLVIDENAEAGGLRLQALEEIAAASTVRLARFAALAQARESLAAAAAALATADVEFRPDTRAVAGYAPGTLVIRRGGELATVRADEIVWAAGALDVLGLFPGNDTAGVFGPRAVLRLLVRDRMDVAGRHALLVGGGDDLWLVGLLLAVRGARVSVVVTGGGMQAEISAAVDLKWTLTTGLELAAVARRGGDGLSATFTPGRNGPGRAETHLRMEADLLVICRRAKPAYDIPYQLGCPLALRPDAGGFVAPPRSELAAGVGLTVVGEAAGDGIPAAKEA